MKSKFNRLLMTGAGLFVLGAAPSLFASDLSRDFSQLRHENRDIRADRRHLHEDVKHGRYQRAERERRDLRHDYRERNDLRRDIWQDERERR